MPPELRMASMIRDIALLSMTLLYAITRILRKKGIYPMPFAFFCYSLIVGLRVLLNGFSGVFVEHAVTDHGYIFSVFLTFTFSIANWHQRTFLFIKESIKFAIVPLTAFLAWEIKNPAFAIWARLGRYRSTLLSPTMFGQFSGIVAVLSLSDLINGRSSSVKNLLYTLLAIVSVYFSGSRTTLIVVLITFLFVNMIIRGEKKARKMSISVFLIMTSLVLLVLFWDSHIFSARVFSLDIKGDARLTGLLREIDELCVRTVLFGSTPPKEAPLDISWFVIIKRLGVLGFLSFLGLNIYVFYSLAFQANRDVQHRAFYEFLCVIIVMGSQYLFTTNLFNAFPLNLYYFFGLGAGMSQTRHVKGKNSSKKDKV